MWLFCLLDPFIPTHIKSWLRLWLWGINVHTNFLYALRFRVMSPYGTDRPTLRRIVTANSQFDLRVHHLSYKNKTILCCNTNGTEMDHLFPWPFIPTSCVVWSLSHDLRQCLSKMSLRSFSVSFWIQWCTLLCRQHDSCYRTYSSFCTHVFWRTCTGSQVRGGG